MSTPAASGEEDVMAGGHADASVIVSGSFKEGDDNKNDDNVAAFEVVDVDAKPAASAAASADDDKKEEAMMKNVVDVDDDIAPSGTMPGGGRAARRRTTVKIDVGSMAFDVDIPKELETSKTNELRQTLLKDEEFLRAKGDDVRIGLPVRRINAATCQCCGIMCSLWVLSLALLIVLSIAVGTIEFDIGVPFYDRAEINQEREDAYLATQRDADYVATIKSTADGNTLCVHEAPTTMTRNGTILEGPAPGENCQLATTQRLRILYISSDRESNILTSENLEQIEKIEQDFLSRLQLTQYCHFIQTNYSAFTSRNSTEIVATLEATANATETNYRSCSRMVSVLNFMDEHYYQPENGLGYHLLPADLIPQEFDLSQQNIDEVVDYWSDYETQSFNLTAFPAAVQQVGHLITLPNIFLPTVSSDFVAGQGVTEAVGVTSTYDLGLPINGYSSSSQSTTEQYEETGQWLWEEYDSFFKSAGFEGVDVFVGDTEQGILNAETGALAIQSFMLFPASLLFVLLYLIYMQDSFYVGLVGVMQILLCFIPGLIIYRYVFGITYLGVLNLIAIYIILGIGVDDLFVFCDQWKHQQSERRFDQRLQKTFNIASRAMFTTSCTTFIAFVSNAGSAFPAIATFGIFAAVLVMVNFCAITFFFPAAFGVYFKYIRGKWFDHPSRLFCCNMRPYTDDIYIPPDEDTVVEGNTAGGGSDKNGVTDPTTTKNDGNNSSEEEEVKALPKPVAGDDNEEQEESDNLQATKEADAHDEHNESRLVRFFRDTWAPLMIKLRYPIVLLFIGVFAGAMYLAAGIEPDEEAPNTLPEDNMYRQYTDVLLEYFARSGNPRAIEVFWVGGINPDDPIDRTGTEPTNTTDYGTANYVDCSLYDPTTMEAQVWSLKTCQDIFWGNVTEFHEFDEEGKDLYDLDGPFGPRQRKIVTDRVPYNLEWYYQLVNCPSQGFRDWLLTDYGCRKLKENDLQCHDETSARPNCTTWDTEGNSCEPYPVQPDKFGILFEAFMNDPNTDPSTRLSNYDRYYREVFIAEIPDLSQQQSDNILTRDFSCRTGEELVFLAMSSTATLDQTFEQNYEVGIDLYELWDQWSIQMRKFAPREMISTMQTSNGVWSYYYLNETLLDETFTNIALSLVLSFIVLSIIGGNPIMALYSVLTIFFIVVDIFAFTVLMGYKLGVLEAVNYVVVIGLSIDYTVHLSEAYTESHATDRHGRVVLMMEEMGVSVLSGAISTLGACFFMFFAPNTFFVKFATFIFATISLSCIYSLTFFPAMLAIIGPTGNVGNCCFWGAKRWRQFKHMMTVEYLDTEEFRRRELANRYMAGEIETLVHV